MYRYRSYNQSAQKAFGYAIKVALFERSISMPYLCTLLTSQGFKYNYKGLQAALDGKSTSNLNFNYYANIFNVLSLPLPTTEYLHNSYLKWLSIQAFKLNRRNENRIKKGLLPVTSISTRVK